MANKVLYEYYIPEFEEEEHKQEFSSEFGSSDDWDYKWTAEAICKERFCDWDYVCPELMMLRRVGETEWREFSLDVEQVPEFSAWRKKA
jgi:hypothetical protein